MGISSFRHPNGCWAGSLLGTASIAEQLLPKWLTLPVFCSDPISPVAYATQEMMIVLGLAGTTLLGLSWRLGLAIAALLVVVVLSYRQICWAQPNGGGAYVVSRANLGHRAALVAARLILTRLRHSNGSGRPWVSMCPSVCVPYQLGMAGRRPAKD